MTMKPTLPVYPVPTSARREWVVVGILTLVAAVLRFWAFGRLGLTHFDEGVYALAGLWSLSPKGLASLDPQVIAYAPPGFPILVGVAYTLLGVADSTALLVAEVCGVLTVPVAAWVGRRTFGPGAGAAASAFAAIALAHVAFSRKALTDVPFLLAWLAAVGIGGWFLERPRFGRAVAFGLAVGLAQNLKYHGWLAGAVVAAAAVAGLAVSAEERRPGSVLRTFGLGLFAALVAGGCDWPWFSFVESHGGYASLLRHQQSYMGGTSTWWPYWETQLAQVVALSGGVYWGLLTWATAWLSAAFAANGLGLVAVKSRWELARLRLGLLAGGVAMAAVPDLGWWVGLAWSAWLFTDQRPAPRVLAIWWVALSALTPFYHPYARLWLPLHAAGWLLLAGAVARLGPFSETVLSSPELSKVTRPRVLAQSAAAVACLLFSRAHWVETPPSPLPVRSLFKPTDDLRIAVFDLHNASPLPTDEPVRLRVLGRRSVAFYLALHGKIGFRLLPDEKALLEGPVAEGEWALVDEVQIAEGKPLASRQIGVNRLWAPAASWENRLDPVTLLDVNPLAPFEEPEQVKTVPLVLLAPRVGPVLLPGGPTRARGSGTLGPSR
jgi:4-amino-4-deoxy-L-arabinose transferase-like glycosyltransferase